MELHDLTAAYAVDALDPTEAREYERHLAACARCRDELAELQEAASALAFAVDAPPPPPQLRERILEQARGERANVVPLRRNRPFTLAAATATLAAAAAVLLALWGVDARRDLDRERSANAELVEVVGHPGARRIPMGEGSLIVAPDGRAAIVIDDLPAAPGDSRYHAWVIEDGRPTPAGVFDEGEYVLPTPVEAGDTVAVTLERGPVEQPTSAPVMTARA